MNDIVIPPAADPVAPPAAAPETPPVETPPVTPQVPAAPDTPPAPPADPITPEPPAAPVELTAEQKAAAALKNDETGDDPVARIVPDVADYVLPEGVPVEMAQFANDNDFTQEQLDASMLQFATITQANEEAQKAAIHANGVAHSKTWGKQRERNLSLVQRALAQNDPDGKLTEVLQLSGYGSHPQVLNFLLSIGTSMQEGGFLKGSMNTPKGSGGMTAANAMFGKNHPSAN